jgi:hypothetical protein
MARPDCPAPTTITSWAGRPSGPVRGVSQGARGWAVRAISAQVTNILVLDRAPKGFEGPWLTYARMRTLRSPKDLSSRGIRSNASQAACP